MIKTKAAILLLPITLFTAQSSYAEWSFSDAWKTTKEVSGSAYESSKEYTNKALDKSKDYYDNLTNEAVDPNSITSRVIESDKKEHIKEVWSDVLKELDGALILNTRIDAAPVSSFFSADKGSLGEDQVDVFEEIEALLSSPAIAKNRRNIDALKKKVQGKQDSITHIKEKRVVADNDERATYDKQIKKAQADIQALTQRINNEKNILKRRFNASGLLLSDAQVDVLLSRVDANDIIKMSLVYDVLADITAQLMGLTKESNENIDQARKYYGMHVVLLKLVINMQDSYVKKLDDVYLPKIETIRIETLRINQDSSRLLSKENKNDRKNLLRKNIKAQQLTLKVAKLYAQQLNHQKAKVKKARNLIADDYRVAKNTYDTVKISADLIQLMKSNRASFNALMNIQIPEIVPFENLEMQRKFEEMSSMIK